LGLLRGMGRMGVQTGRIPEESYGRLADVGSVRGDEGYTILRSGRLQEAVVVGCVQAMPW
jgi:hypothetical protein